MVLVMITRWRLAPIALAALALTACGTSAHHASTRQACTAADDAGTYVARITGTEPSSKDPSVIVAEVKAATWPTAAERSAARRLSADIAGGASQADYETMLPDSLVLFRVCGKAATASP